MYSPSLKKIALDYIKSKYPEAVHKGEIDRLAITQWGYLTENCGRRLRELARAGYIQPIYEKGKSGVICVSYRAIPREERAKVEMSSEEILKFACM